MSLPKNFDTHAWARSNRYVRAHLVNGNLIAIAPQTFGKFRIVIGDDPTYINHAY